MYTLSPNTNNKGEGIVPSDNGTGPNLIIMSIVTSEEALIDSSHKI